MEGATLTKFLQRNLRANELKCTKYFTLSKIAIPAKSES